MGHFTTVSLFLRFPTKTTVANAGEQAFLMALGLSHSL